MASRAHRHLFRPSTNCYKLSEIGLYDLVTSTTLESNKSLSRYPLLKHYRRLVAGTARGGGAGSSLILAGCPRQNDRLARLARAGRAPCVVRMALDPGGEQRAGPITTHRPGEQRPQGFLLPAEIHAVSMLQVPLGINCDRKCSGTPSFPSSHQKKGTFQKKLV
jgi:hypothetical protein